MKNHGVSWKEGMFLLPQHFQLQEQFHLANSALHQSVTSNSPYGFSQIELNLEKLSAGELEVTRATGITKSGTLFDFQASAAVEDSKRNVIPAVRIDDLISDLIAGKSVDVFIGIRADFLTGNAADELSPRFSEYEYMVHGSEFEGEYPIVLKKLEGRIFIGEENAEGFEMLQVCKLKYLNSPKGQVPGTDPDYFPPSLKASASQTCRDYLADQEDLLTSYLRSLADVFTNRDVTLDGLMSRNFAEPIFRFMNLSELRNWMQTVNNGIAPHPSLVYQTLCQFIGRLAFLAPNRNGILPSLPKYFHHDSASSLRECWNQIRQHYVPIKDSDVQQLKFHNEEIESKNGKIIVSKINRPLDIFLDSEVWKLYLGFYFGGMQRGDAKDFFSKYFLDGKYVYGKFGDQTSIDGLFEKVDKGVSFEMPPKREQKHIQEKGWLFSEIVEDHNWDLVCKTKSLCFRLDERNLSIGQTQMGSDEIVIAVDDRGKKKLYNIKISLWAVRIR